MYDDCLGFLQKPQSITIYVDLAGVGSLHRELILVEYGRRSLDIVVNNLNGKTYELTLPNLAGDIVPEKCKHKVGSNIKCKRGHFYKRDASLNGFHKVFPVFFLGND